jgi:2-keto-4-pentenoate hydratase/2-oxohepta-3-ene-1,7-dioic acid hydratase in catechol pathway
VAFADTYQYPRHLRWGTDMKWLRFSHQGQVGFGSLQDDVIHVHTGHLFQDPRPSNLTLPLAAVQIVCPCEPTKIVALWNNFRAAAEKNGWQAPAEPLYFLKSPNSYAHHLQPVIRPQGDVGRVIFEAELGIVIGRSGKNISIEDSSHHIFGYTCLNDVTAVELLRADTSFDQWTRAKNFDGFTPFGPWIETEWDGATARVKATVNGRERQNYPVSDMFFSPQELVSRLSRDMTLVAGDIIACGTSLGAMPWQNDVVVEVSIEGIGSLSNILKESS